MAQRTCEADGCERKHLARGLCKMHWTRQYGKRTKYPITCEMCGVNYLSDRPTGRFCSDTCKAETYRIERRAHSRALVGPIERAVTMLPDRHPVVLLAKQSRPRVWYAGICPWCGTSFVDNQPAARFCSMQCGKAMGKVKRGRFLVPLAVRLSIYARDRWTCQLCLEPVDPTLMDMEPGNDWAPSLDHVECQAWTLAPDHSPGNLRLAHRWCNAVRGDGRYYTENDLRISPAA